MSNTSPLIVICFDSEQTYAVALGDLARSVGFPDAQVISGPVSAAIAAMNARSVPPEYMIIDIASRGSDVLRDIDALAEHCEPTLRVVVIGSVNDISFYREVKNRGILEYFNRPAQASDIRTALIQSSMGAGSGGRGTVIACMSAASGDGASTVAVNLAYCLATQFRQPTVLVDMDYQFGLVAGSLDVTASFGIHELFDNPDRGLDVALVDKMLVKYGAYLNIIASPGELRMLPAIRAEHVSELIRVLRSRFTFVVLDVPHVWTPWTAAALTYADHRMMVAQLWLRSLTHASRLLKAWQSIGISAETVSLVVNRSGAKFKEAITAEDFERICHHPIEAHVGNDIKAVAQAETQGKTIFETGQGTMIQKQVQDIARSLASRYQSGLSPADAPTEAAASSSKKGLKGLFDKR
jgi:pilus assembly protein CpaE